MIEEWYPDHPPIYDIHKTWAENAIEGPFFKGTIPKRPESKPFDFLGYKVNSPLGVPSGPLLNSRWIALAGKLGFDIPAYKTIRSYAHPSHALPNVVFVKPVGPHKAISIDEPTESISDLSITNSFGNPSKSPDFLLEDIARANASLSKGQVMIVSVYGTPNQGVSFCDDFVRAAVLAKEAGAKIIEANFSCPNVDKAEGILYMSPDTVYEFTKKISDAIKPIPFLMKVGIFPNEQLMKEVFIAAARGGARGVAGINTLSMEVLDKHGKPALGESRRTAGVCGGAIRGQAHHFIHKAAEIIRQEKLAMVLLGCGGIMRPEHFTEFLDLGAQVAMSATGMMWDPYLALRYHQMRKHEHSLHHS